MLYALNNGTVVSAEAKIKELTEENDRFAEALRIIATPMRPDGTYNRERHACYILAK